MGESKRTKVNIMIIRFEVIADNGKVYTGDPITYKSIHGTASECYRQIADKFHEMARQDEEFTRQLNRASDEAMKKLQDDVWKGVGKA